MRVLVGSLILSSALVAEGSAAAQTPLQRLPGILPAGTTVAQDVNEDGLIVGYGQGIDGAFHPLRWTQGGRDPEELPLPGGIVSATATGVNRRGVAAGTCTAADSTSRACQWDTAGGALLLPPGGADSSDQALRVNDRGQVVGQSAGTQPDGSFAVHAMLWEPGQPARDLGTLPGGDFSQAFDVNASGEVVGASNGSATEGMTHAALWTAAGVEDLGTLPGDMLSAAVAINEHGVVVGYSMGFSPSGDFQARSFVWTRAGGMQDIGLPAGSSLIQAADVSSTGNVVGFFYDTAFQQHAFEWTAQHGLRDLGTLPGGTFSTATAVNGLGTIVGQSDSGNPSGVPFAFEREGLAPTDTTAPVSSAQATPAPNANGWNNSDVLVEIFASDLESGVKELHWAVNGNQHKVTGDRAAVALSGDGQWSVAHQALDKAGNSERAGSPLVVRIDTVPPQLTAQVAGKPFQNGWYRSDVTVSFTAVDLLSGVAFVSAPVTVTTDGANQQATGSARDLADNEASVVVGGISIDRTAPVLSLSVSESELWPPNKELRPVVVSGRVADALSGFGTLTLALSSSEPDSVRGAGNTQGDVNGQDGFREPVLLSVQPDSQGRFQATVQLRAERNSPRTTRVYTVQAAASDRAGNSSRAATVVRVPASGPELRTR